MPGQWHQRQKRRAWALLLFLLLRAMRPFALTCGVPLAFVAQRPGLIEFIANGLVGREALVTAGVLRLPVAIDVGVRESGPPISPVISSLVDSLAASAAESN